MFNPTSLEKGLRAIFLSQLAMSKASLLDKIATVVPSTYRDEKYAWLGESPQMEEIVDEFKSVPVSDTGYTLTNKKYGAMLEVRREDLADDATGGIVMRTRQLAAVAARNTDKLLVSALTSGGTDLCYDGAAFFTASHPARGKSGTQSNLVSQTGTTTAAVATDINTAISQMIALKAENGEPFHDMPTQFVIMAGPALRKPVREAVNAAIISQTSNVQLQGDSIELIFSARLTGNTWYLLNTDGPVRPLLFQDREPLEFTALEAANDSDSTFRREVYSYKVRQRCRAGYSFWQKAMKVA